MKSLTPASSAASCSLLLVSAASLSFSETTCSSALLFLGGMSEQLGTGAEPLDWTALPRAASRLQSADIRQLPKCVGLRLAAFE